MDLKLQTAKYIAAASVLICILVASTATSIGSQLHAQADPSGQGADQGQGAGEASPAEASPDSDADQGAPGDSGESPTDSEVMYNVFAAELLGSEGNLEGAVTSYLEAAMESDDPAIAQRATRVALAAQSWYQAAMAADRWALLAPDDMAAREAAAATMLATHDYVGAELQLEEILKRNKDEADAWLLVTSLLAQAADPGKAGEILSTPMGGRRMATRYSCRVNCSRAWGNLSKLPCLRTRPSN
jgi:predicted Zn-dependent protease